MLQLLFGHPERSYLASELIRLAEAGSGAVQRELIRLVASRLVNVQESGRQRHYRANPESPVFDELRKIVLKTSGIPEAVRSALTPLANRIALALIYGSVAKGEASSASDVDLLLVSDSLRLENLHSALEPAEIELGRKIRPTLYSRQEFARRRRDRAHFSRECFPDR